MTSIESSDDNIVTELAINSTAVTPISVEFNDNKDESTSNKDGVVLMPDNPSYFSIIANVTAALCISLMVFGTIFYHFKPPPTQAYQPPQPAKQLIISPQPSFTITPSRNPHLVLLK